MNVCVCVSLAIEANVAACLSWKILTKSQNFGVHSVWRSHVWRKKSFDSPTRRFSLLTFFALLLRWSSIYPNRNLSGEIHCKRFGAVTTIRIWHVRMSRWWYWCNRSIGTDHMVCVIVRAHVYLSQRARALQLNINVVNATYGRFFSSSHLVFNYLIIIFTYCCFVCVVFVSPHST